ncbi:MAG: hypothetical protein ACYC7E_11005 [Armatimonadota bacterium]
MTNTRRYFMLPAIALLIAAALIGPTSRAWAGASGLATIPTADIVPAGHFCPSVSLTRLADAEDDLSVNTQFGVLPWLEAGYDYSFTNTTGVGNVKLGFNADTGGLAFGVQNLGAGEQWYAAGTLAPRWLAPVRLHLGAFDPTEDPIPFLGIDFPVKGATVMLEGIDAPQRSAAAGLAFQIVNRLDVLVSGIFTEGGKPQLYFELGCTFPLGHTHNK